MIEIVKLLAVIASGVGGIVTVFAYLRMQRTALDEGPMHVSSPPPAPAEPKHQEKRGDSKQVSFRPYEARRRQIELVVKDLRPYESVAQRTYTLHEIERLLSWEKVDSKTPLVPIICDNVLKSLHRKYLSKWATGPSAVKAKMRAREVGRGKSKTWELVDEFDAFPEMPSFEAITRRIEQRDRAKNLFLGAVSLLALGLAILIGTSVDSIGAGIAALLFLGFLLSGVVEKLSERVEAALSTPLWNWSETLHGDGENLLSHSETFDPKWIYWHPYLPLIFVTKDHLRFNS
uniref:Uncharacterized protein n=1 Tax=Candidatus Kentrum sp. LPFa TaxID=2126335 RepID=A0A450XXQ1_9GAMM|nr:MAG: hypothetical protein BECKLPF1236A_GA0070988_102303 [Candidatus Kentron sp. LPFa]VFK34053.1 MAG: hypothetical protein BECKLPF1236C_GA0070990_102413 [Candidatus Kentron sp. LPFa]